MKEFRLRFLPLRVVVDGIWVAIPFVPRIAVMVKRSGGMVALKVPGP
jgi:hypothetical protein